MEGEEQNKEYEEQSIMTSTTKRSWVWNHYVFDENAKKAQCNHCKVFIAINKGSTSGMSNHLKSKHGITKDGVSQVETQVETQKSIEISVSV
jgi:hypothetical protein